MNNVVVDDNLEGYVYIFNYSSEYEHTNENSIQYKSHKNIKPIDVIKIRFADFKRYYIINDNNI